MGELLDAAVSPANIVVTGLAIFILIYWITVIIGLVDLDMFDIDLDMDGDVDADGGHVGWLNSVLAFFNLSQIPIMIFFSFLIFPAWGIMMITTDFLGVESFWLGLVVLIPVLFVSLFIAKFLTTPFVKIFGKLSEDPEEEVIIGKICEVTISTRSDKVGQGRIVTKGAPHLLNVCSTPGTELKKGDMGLIIEHLKDRNVYLIEPYNN